MTERRLKTQSANIRGAEPEKMVEVHVCACGMRSSKSKDSVCDYDRTILVSESRVSKLQDEWGEWGAIDERLLDEKERNMS